MAEQESGERFTFSSTPSYLRSSRATLKKGSAQKIWKVGSTVIRVGFSLVVVDG